MQAEQQIQAIKVKLVAQNKKFTNYSIDGGKIEDCLRKFSTQEIVVNVENDRSWNHELFNKSIKKSNKLSGVSL